ncbi:hypothetical protein DMNBHIDG_01275 [Candidatus Methanoperedenaceae archaeon GB37]|nr:hypothetical protein DMNBHIDG_01275 [Candidatus Methanoperedenaceae archaeon GB37]
MPDRVNLPIEPRGQQETITINMVAYKYMLTDTGVIFVINTDSLPEPEKTLNIAKANNSVFLQSGKVYVLLTDSIIEHVKKVMSEGKKVSISFASSLPEEYQIKTNYTVVLDIVNCATLVSLYKIAK